MKKRLLFISIFLLSICQFSVAQDLEKVADIKSITKRKPFEFGGSIGLGAGFYNSNGISQRMAPWNWYVSGSPFVKIYGLDIPFTFIYSETGRSLTHPFHYNFTGASPHYKWATSHLGYRSMNFSDYTVSGVVFNGVGLELKPGKLRFGAFYGIFNPAVEADTSGGNFGVILPSYKRIGYGVKLGVGTDRNYFDLIYFRGKDDPKSLKEVPAFKTITPSDNVTFSPRFKVTLFKRWFVESDIALSVFTRNVLNDTLRETDDLKTAYQFIRVNTTSYGAFAGHVATGLNFNRWSIAFRVRQVSSDYQSMGINLLQDDIREYTASPTFTLFKGKLGLSGSYGFYTDNVSNKRLNTTVRKIYNTNASLQISKRVSVSGGYSNFGTSRTNGLVQMNDSITFSIINESYNANLNIMLGKIKKPVMLSFFSQYQKADDRNVFTRQFNNSEVVNAGSSASYKWERWGLQTSGGLSYARFIAAETGFSTQNANLTLRKQMGKKKNTVSINSNYSRRFKESDLQGNVVSLGLTYQASIGKRHSLSTQVRFMRNSTGIISNSVFNEQRFSIQYGFKF